MCLKPMSYISAVVYGLTSYLSLNHPPERTINLRVRYTVHTMLSTVYDYFY